jgi:hypothetical protein
MCVVSTTDAAETHKLASPHAGGGRKAYEAMSMTSDDEEDDEDEEDTQEIDAGDRDGDDGATETDSGGSSMECNLEDGLERRRNVASSKKSRRTGPSMSTKVPAARKTRTKTAAGKIKGTVTAGNIKRKAAAVKTAAP